MPPGFAFCAAVAFFHCTHPPARAMPQSRERKQDGLGLVESLRRLNCHHPHPEHSQQSGSREGAGLAGLCFLAACLPFGLSKAMAADPWCRSSNASAAASYRVVFERAGRARRRLARTRQRRSLSCADLESTIASTALRSESSHNRRCSATPSHYFCTKHSANARQATDKEEAELWHTSIWN